MTNRGLVVLVLGVFCLQGTGCNRESQVDDSNGPPVTHENFIKKIDDVWMVVDSQPDIHGLVVKRDDRITWRSDSSDVEFQFPSNYSRFFSSPSDQDQERDAYRKVLKAGDVLELTVRSDAPADTVYYAVLVKKDCVLAEGDSTPAIIIEDQ